MKFKKKKKKQGGVGVQTKTGRLIFPFDKSGVGIFPCLNIYSPVASACAGVRFFQNDRGSVWEGHTWVRCLSHIAHIYTGHLCSGLGCVWTEN